MIEVFVRQFLTNLNTLTRGGLARRYVPVEENLPYLRGRLLFREQIRENLINQARFYVAHDELSVNRPANRLIHSALTWLMPLVRDTENHRLLQQMRVGLADVPLSANPHADWQRHQVDRSMPHYGPVMQWVGLFLLGHGLVTLSGRHRNLSLLFPMEQVFEDFVTHSFRRYQSDYRVTAQGPQKPLASLDGRDAFMGETGQLPAEGRPCRLHTRLRFLEEPRHVVRRPEARHRPSRSDTMLYAYAKGYDCNAVTHRCTSARQYFRTKRFVPTPQTT